MFTLEEYIFKQDVNVKFLFKHKQCGTIFESYYEAGKHLQCPKCFKNTKSYIQELLMIDIKQQNNNLDILLNNRHILVVNLKRLNNREIDIWIKQLKLGIEYNGNYWHSAKKLNENIYEPKYNLLYCKQY